jgi:hypothetical protein
VAAGGNYRYLRYLSPDGGYCNVTEIEFVKNESNGRPASSGKRERRDAIGNIQAFPNPAGKTVYLTGLSSKTGRCMITLSGLNGRIVFHRQLQTASATAVHPLDLSGVPRGVYVLRINMPGANKSIKLVRL